MGVLLVALWIISGAGAESLGLGYTHNPQIAIACAFVICALWAWVIIRLADRS